jgi:Tetratricopeptide repeat
MQTDTTKTGNIMQMLIGIAVIGFFVVLFGGAWNGFFRMPRAFQVEEKKDGRVTRYESFYEALAAKKPQDAVKAAEVIFKKDPKGPKIDEVRVLTLDTYMELRQYDKAIVLAQQLSHLHPKNPRYRFVLAKAFWGLGRRRDAQNTYLELSLRKDLTPTERDDVRDALKAINDDPLSMPVSAPVENKSKPESDAPATPVPTELPIAAPIPAIPGETSVPDVPSTVPESPAEKQTEKKTLKLEPVAPPKPAGKKPITTHR